MFRIQDMVPEVYPDQSRDFQIFCRAYDVAFNGVKQAIDSMNNLSSTQLCDSSVLELLQSKLGFFSSIAATDADMRCVLQAFPHIIKYKGSKKAVEYIVNLYSRLVSATDISIDVTGETRVIELSSNTPIRKTDLLVALLKYIIPTGYTVDYYITSIVNETTNVNTQSKLDYYVYDTITEEAGEKSVRYNARVVIHEDLQSTESTEYPESRELSNIVNIANVADSE